MLEIVPSGRDREQALIEERTTTKPAYQLTNLLPWSHAVKASVLTLVGTLTLLTHSLTHLLTERLTDSQYCATPWAAAVASAVTIHYCESH